MKILCLISWPPNGRWLWDYLPDNQDHIDFVYITHPKDRFPGYGKLLGYYQKFWWLGFKAFRNMEDYDVIVTWEANTGLPLAFLRTLLNRKTPPLVILNFVLKGKPILDWLALTRYAIQSVNQIVCLSNREITSYSELLNFPTERCAKLQGPFPDSAPQALTDIKTDNYIFAAGRSHRDYGTLFEAVRDLPVKLIVNARSFNLEGLEIPSNVKVNPFLPYNEFLALLWNAKFVVLPLFEAQHASGETFLMQAASSQKAIIATTTYSIAEIIEHRINGLLVEPGDVEGMRAAILYLLEHPKEALRMGQTARQHYLSRWSFPVAAANIDQLLRQVVDNHK